MCHLIRASLHPRPRCLVSQDASVWTMQLLSNQPAATGNPAGGNDGPLHPSAPNTRALPPLPPHFECAATTGSGELRPLATRDTRLSQLLAPLLAGNVSTTLLGVVSSERCDEANQVFLPFTVVPAATVIGVVASSLNGRLHSNCFQGQALESPSNSHATIVIDYDSL